MGNAVGGISGYDNSFLKLTNVNKLSQLKTKQTNIAKTDKPENKPQASAPEQPKMSLKDQEKTMGSSQAEMAKVQNEIKMTEAMMNNDK